MVENKLRELRKKSGLSQVKLARLAHCSRATIIWIERLGHFPTRDVRLKLAIALGISELAIWPQPVKILAHDRFGNQPNCLVCDNGKVAEINKALQNRRSLRDIEAEFNVSRSTLSRHKIKHLVT